jgi:hypothetical protein
VGLVLAVNVMVTVVATVDTVRLLGCGEISVHGLLGLLLLGAFLGRRSFLLRKICWLGSSCGDRSLGR